jgi:hypothetical protein
LPGRDTRLTPKPAATTNKRRSRVQCSQCETGTRRRITRLAAAAPPSFLLGGEVLQGHEALDRSQRDPQLGGQRLDPRPVDLAVCRVTWEARATALQVQRFLAEPIAWCPHPISRLVIRCDLCNAKRQILPDTERDTVFARPRHCALSGLPVARAKFCLYPQLPMSCHPG